CQHTKRHPFTGTDPGGFGWSDLSGAVPDADDTPGAVLALLNTLALIGPCEELPIGHRQMARMVRSSVAALRWLIRLRNSDGGWPTFCRGWGRLPFDRSGADLTAHSLRALAPFEGARESVVLDRALRFLKDQQRPDGSWLPLWFGNQHMSGETNPTYGTARVL